MGIGAMEWLLIFLIVLLLFGAKRLPEIARSLGKATQEFRKAKNEIVNSVEGSDTNTGNNSAPPAEAPAKNGGQSPKQDA
ncbi:MAG: Sec-independent protein translocase subunit TatA/TatB [Lentisphaeria bacterium]|jgi:sec-independent protein translocase protein TatA